MTCASNATFPWKLRSHRSHLRVVMETLYDAFDEFNVMVDHSVELYDVSVGVMRGGLILLLCLVCKTNSQWRCWLSGLWAVVSPVNAPTSSAPAAVSLGWAGRTGWGRTRQEGTNKKNAFCCIMGNVGLVFLELVMILQSLCSLSSISVSCKIYYSPHISFDFDLSEVSLQPLDGVP